MESKKIIEHGRRELTGVWVYVCSFYACMVPTRSYTIIFRQLSGVCEAKYFIT